MRTAAWVVWGIAGGRWVFLRAAVRLVLGCVRSGDHRHRYCTLARFGLMRKKQVYWRHVQLLPVPVEFGFEFEFDI